jgi:hypothetical protein
MRRLSIRVLWTASGVRMVRTEQAVHVVDRYSRHCLRGYLPGTLCRIAGAFSPEGHLALLSKFGPVVLMDLGPPRVPQPTAPECIGRPGGDGCESSRAVRCSIGQTALLPRQLSPTREMQAAVGGSRVIGIAGSL